ncbi:glycosyltransferase family 9 protein [Oscillatoria laete-virens NRMC-F 0139]|nr:glycosyltransferase family 9 protein [Oscillatoria laete-virens]MDL5052713.1 glycosyltransferase family 9 protein [Oscillatoria laete-virens NRMC-F 0139]
MPPHNLRGGLEKIGIFPNDFTPRVQPGTEDRAQAEDLLKGHNRPLIALHPGSGSRSKNWPPECWGKLLGWLLGESDASIGVVLGEADVEVENFLSPLLSNPRVVILRHLSLPVLAAALVQATVFIGHDSGVSHLAAAVGTPVISLFGPTNPVIWGPVGAEIIRKGSSMNDILVEDVQFALAKHNLIR